METICKTCGAVDSRISNGDNSCCKECGDTEGLIFLEDYNMFISSTTIGGDCPHQYLEIYAQTEMQARVVSRAVLDKNWSFIYPEEQGHKLIGDWGWKEHAESPIVVDSEETFEKFFEIVNKKSKS